MKKKEEISGNGISRRDFIKGAATGAAAVAAASVLPGCATAGPGAGRADTPQGGDWLGEAPNIPDRQIAETMNCDVLVIGAGMGGLLAAARAVENRLSVIVVDKNETGAGIKNYIGAIDSRLMKAQNIRIDKGEIIHELTRYCAGRLDVPLLKVWADESGAAVDWFLDIMARYNIETHLEWDIGNPAALYKTWPICHGFDFADAKDVENALHSVINANGKILFQTPMKRLVQERGRVAGAIMQRADGSYLRVTASRGVVLSTGGYSRDYNMMMHLNPYAIRGVSSTPNRRGITGDGIRAGLWAGGAFEKFHTAMIFDRSTLPPGTKTSGPPPHPDSRPFRLVSQPFLRVNLLGERFSNESTPYDFAVHHVANQPDNKWVTVFDSNWREHVARFAATGCVRLVPVDGGPVFEPFVNHENILQALLTRGNVQQADTFEELARKVLLPPDTFGRTVRRYNELCDRGVDEDFYKESYRMIKLDRPPYFACLSAGSLLCTLDGLRIDTNMRALDINSKPIEGLFCTGNDSGGFFSSTYPSRVVGIAAGRTLTFSKRIADLLAGRVS